MEKPGPSIYEQRRRERDAARAAEHEVRGARAENVQAEAEAPKPENGAKGDAVVVGQGGGRGPIPPEMIASGEDRLANKSYVAPVMPQLDHDGDGKPGGSLPAEQRLDPGLVEMAKNLGVEIDHRWSNETLRDKIAEKQIAGAPFVDAGGPARVVNNTMRHQYRVLEPDERLQVLYVKNIGAAFLKQLHETGGTLPEGGKFASRELSLAATKIEEAVMWAVKHITR